MDENNQELNQENVEEIFEMEELTETEEKDLTGGASAGKGGYSTFRINLRHKPLSIQNMSVKVDDRWNGKYTYENDMINNAVILKLKTDEMKSQRAKYNIIYVDVKGVTHIMTGTVRFR